MTYTREQITLALAVIKTTCNECGDCTKCPFRMNRDECYINNDEGVFPGDWDILEENNWVAFR